MLPDDIASHAEWFSAYVERFVDGAEYGPRGGGKWTENDAYNVEIKRKHSLRVCKYAKQIAASLNLTPELHRAVLLAALYHDIGRFSQYARYRTFSDAASVNHGFLGSRVIRQENVLDEESPAIRRLVRGTLVLHNRLQLPAGIPEELRTVASVIRDSDKLDIIPVMVAEFQKHKANGPDSVVALHTKDEPDKWSEPVLNALMEKRLGAYGDMVYQNDFKLLVCTWVFDLRFAASRKMLRESNGLEHIMALWPDNPKLEAAKKIVRESLHCG